ncbi:haloacid dehalogenase type II [Lentisphaerota bacterium ZTH]|nr:haloacid dehalogenase type II [Lentisphaerota bacterium]WET06555.1 haloacid dehalogenase type II [Lentisphaerota bacterium ZTH]
MQYSLALDIYGTIVNTSGIYASVQNIIGEKAADFVELWRSKQLEYSFRRSAMGIYADFSVCTREALEFCCIKFNAPLSSLQKEQLMENYQKLPVFPDAETGISRARKAGHTIFAFSNGSSKAICALLEANRISGLFDGIISVEETRKFKPSPAVYSYFLKQANAKKGSTCLVSSNPFDIIGAAVFGMRTIWVRRNEESVFDPWGITPDCTIGGLNELAAVLR